MIPDPAFSPKVPRLNPSRWTRHAHLFWNCSTISGSPQLPIFPEPWQPSSLRHLCSGGCCPAAHPVDLGEADQSQAGKGFRNKLTAAVFRQHLSVVTQKKGGVGSLEESLSAVSSKGTTSSHSTIYGARSILRRSSRFSPRIHTQRRIPYEPTVEIDPRRVVIQMTSNKAELTPDFANRSSCVRIVKQPENHPYKRYAEGDVLDHVRANQPLYLGAVFSVVQEWYARGRPQTRENRHDFRTWARTLDWIVQELFDLPPLMDGHLETKLRMTNPSLSWLRDVANLVRHSGRLGEPLRANQILDLLAEQPDPEIPGLTETEDLADEDTWKKVLQAMGRKLALCFRDRDEVRLDDIIISREVSYEADSRHQVRNYRFESALWPSSPIGAL